MKPQAVLTQWVHPDVVARLARRCAVAVNPTREILAPDNLKARLAAARAVMVFPNDLVDEAFLRSAPRLKVVAAALTGADDIDVEACTRRKVWVTTVPDRESASTAELGVALLLALARRMLEGYRHVRSGRFRGWRPVLFGPGIADRTVGIVGMGSLGQALARRLAGFDCRTLYHDPRPLDAVSEEILGVQRASLPMMLDACDAVVLAVPLRPQTKGLVGRKALARMKPGALLVNLARGSVVDEEGVADALSCGRLGGYAADVFAFEDRSVPDRPLDIPAPLLRHPDRTVLTPHLGSAVDEVRRDLALEAAGSILDVLEGRRPRGAVNDLPSPGARRRRVRGLALVKD